MTTWWSPTYPNALVDNGFSTEVCEVLNAARYSEILLHFDVRFASTLVVLLNVMV